MWERRGAYRVLVGKAEVKRPIERPKHGWEILACINGSLKIKWGID
jgi:hypothetical protein